MKWVDRLSTSLSAFLVMGITVALAAPDGIIRNSIAICNPYNPTQCSQPDVNGNLPVGATTPLPTYAGHPTAGTTLPLGHTETQTAGGSKGTPDPVDVYGIQVTSGAVAGYVMVFLSEDAPPDGVVEPTKCFRLPATSTLDWNLRPGPPLYSPTGVNVVFSSTGCFIKTQSDTAFIAIDLQGS